MITRTSRAAIVVAAAIAILAGCAQAPAYDPTTAERLQSQVLAVSTSTSQGDWAGASTRLMELEASAAEALARGDITQERFDAIIAALQLVRGDVDAAIAQLEEEARAAQAAADAKAAADAEAARIAAEEAARQQEDKSEDKGKSDDKKEDDD